MNIVSTPKAGWQIQEALGVGNSELSESTFKDIQSHIEFRKPANVEPMLEGPL